MFKQVSRPVVTAVMALFVGLSMVSGTATAEDKRDFANLVCKDVMRLSGGDRDISLAFAHGYVLGRKGTTAYDVDALSQLTDRFIDYCLDHPNDKALQSFERLAN